MHLFGWNVVHRHIDTHINCKDNITSSRFSGIKYNGDFKKPLVPDFDMLHVYSIAAEAQKKWYPFTESITRK